MIQIEWHNKNKANIWHSLSENNNQYSKTTFPAEGLAEPGANNLSVPG